MKCPGVPDAKVPQKDEAEKMPLKMDYTIHVATPLFGGGVTAGVNDPVTVIRGPAIRGQLRFWWRATRGARFETVEALKKEENRIWGSTQEPGKVSLAVKTKPGIRKPYGKFDDKKFICDYPEYAGFPFVDLKNKTVKEITSNIEFTITLTMAPTVNENDVKAALWAWVNFGGLGARTRRGCGSLYCKEFAPPQNNEIKSWYEKQLKAYDIIPSPAARKWPTVPQAHDIVVKPSPVKPVQAWREAVNQIKTFRQGTGVGRNSGSQPNRPGRSLWPEPDSLRKLTDMTNHNHKDPIIYEPNAFPRAEFGMPIIFHFKDTSDPGNPDPQLLPEEGDRMGSPLIIKALCIGKDSAYPCIMRLKTEKLDRARVQHNNDHSIMASDIRNPRFSQYNKSPMAGLSKDGSALEAFMNYARVKGGYK
jgi:CRISPR-associated protein Cmr1